MPDVAYHRFFGCHLQGSFVREAGILFASSLVGAALGLAISARSSTTETAIALLPVVLLPIITLGGGIRAVYKMPAPARALSFVVPSRWAFERDLIDEAPGHVCGYLPGPDRWNDCPSGGKGVDAATLQIPSATAMVNGITQPVEPAGGKGMRRSFGLTLGALVPCLPCSSAPFWLSFACATSCKRVDMSDETLTGDREEMVVRIDYPMAASEPLVAARLRSHPGAIRSHNQDRVARFRIPLGDLVLVADGVGGHADGEKAASITTTEYGRVLASAPSSADPESALHDATAKVRQRIAEAAATASGGQPGMASTVALVLIHASMAYVGHIGDTRVYLVRRGALMRLTGTTSSSRE